MTMTHTVNQPRKLTEAERADEAARAERALSGQQRPRTLHALCAQATRLVPCGNCGQAPGRACTDAGGVDGYHLQRFARARRMGLLTAGEMARVIGLAEVITTGTIVRDGAR